MLPELFLTLIKNKTHIIGTMRSNKSNIPKDFIETKLKRGEYSFEIKKKLDAILGSLFKAYKLDNNKKPLRTYSL